MTDETETLKIVSEICTHRLQKGDRLIVSAPETVSDDTAKRIFKTLNRFFPGHPVLIMGNGMTIQVAHEESAHA